MSKYYLSKYEEACTDILLLFIEKYYLDEEIRHEDMDFYWAGSEIGGIVHINDDFWGFNDILQAIRCNPTKEHLFCWYWDVVMNSEAEINYNLKSFLGLEIWKK
jgi:hypothetical protein